MPKALNQVKIVKKRTKKFFRHQSDRFKSVKVGAPALGLGLAERTPVLITTLSRIAQLAQASRY